jgi:hypothetical protein
MASTSPDHPLRDDQTQATETASHEINIVAEGRTVRDLRVPPDGPPKTR